MPTTPVTKKTDPSVIGDLWGGLAAMLVALPSAIAFGVLVFASISPDHASQGAMVGVIGAAALGIVAGFCGGTPALVSAPCAPAAALLAGLAIHLGRGGVCPERIPGLLALTAFGSALLQILYGLLRGGRLIKYIPYPVVSGYLSGVGLIIAVGQLPKLLGLPQGVGLLQGLSAPRAWQWPCLVVGFLTIFVMGFSPRVTRRVPAAIVALLAGTGCYLVLGQFHPDLMVADANPFIIGPLQTSGSFDDLVSSQVRSLLHAGAADWSLVAYSAVALSMLLSIDTLKTCVVLDALTRSRHNSNRELFGQGIGNLCSCLAGGMPGAGTMGPTLINVGSGGRTRRSGVLAGLLVVLTLLVLRPLIVWVPISALAGILLVIAFRMFDRTAFSLLRSAETRLDFAVIAAVVVVAQAGGLIAAAATGVAMAILLFIRDQIRGSVVRRRATLKDVASKTRRLEAEREILAQEGHLAATVELQGNLFFGTTDQLFSELEPDLQTRQWLLLDMRRVQSMDYTAAHLFEQMHDRLSERGGQLLFSGMPSSLPTRQDIHRYMESTGLVGREGGNIQIFETRDAALEWMEERILQQAGWSGSSEESLLDLKEIELLAGMGKKVEALRACVREQSVPAGERIFRRGDVGDEIFLIRRGTVRILLPLADGKRHHLATFLRGDYFGEMSFLDQRKRSADAKAKTDCDLYVLSKKAFDARAEQDPVLGMQVFVQLAHVLSLRLRQADAELRAAENR